MLQDRDIKREENRETKNKNEKIKSPSSLPKVSKI